jgi:hypothetical protein
MIGRTVRLALAMGLLMTGCSGSGDGGANDGPKPELTAEVASFDLAADRPTRFLVGLGMFTPDGQLFVSGGHVLLSFYFLGEDQATTREPFADETATFLPIAGSDGPFGPEPVAAPGSSGRGVYALEDFEFDRPGFWEVEVTADLEDQGPLTAPGAFEVLPEPLVPAVGDRAPKTENLTLRSEDAPQEAIDSRAATGEIPDPELHTTTVAEAIAEHHPVLVVISTPVYCVSKFCGPVTDMVQELAAEYEDRAEFIHIEVWRDFQGRVVNKAAAEWILRNDTLQEPWVFFIDRDGRVGGRWDNVATRQEIEPFLQGLPRLGG